MSPSPVTCRSRIHAREVTDIRTCGVGPKGATAPFVNPAFAVLRLLPEVTPGYSSRLPGEGKERSQAASLSLLTVEGFPNFPSVSRSSPGIIYVPEALL